MNFWNGIAPLGLALAVRSGSVGADSEEKLAEGRRKERRKKEERELHLRQNLETRP
jgi:hypothetical protein